MPQPRIALEGAAIVFRGSFNPAIFQPAWYAAQQLLSQTDAENAKVEIITPEVCQFHTDQFQIQVLTDKFMVGTTQASHFDALRDLAAGTFRILRHTPLRQLGINRHVHFALDSEEVWHAVGHRLVPKEDWHPILERPGLLSLSLIGVRPDGLSGAVNVRVEPSRRVHPGLFVEVNDHFEVKEADYVNADAISSILLEQWDASYTRAKTIVGHMRGLC